LEWPGFPGVFLGSAAVIARRKGIICIFMAAPSRSESPSWESSLALCPAEFPSRAVRTMLGLMTAVTLLMGME